VPVIAMAARRGSDDLLAASARFPEAAIGAVAPTQAEERRLMDELGKRLTIGTEVPADFAALAGCTVMNGIVGSAGLPASVAALEAGNRLALANKESLVAGGEVVNAALERGEGELIPVDSEHSALAQCLQGEDLTSVRRLILSASGGPFRGWGAEATAAATPEDALRHPTWRMGNRITIDSATLMNKAFEVIEAHFLFGFGYDDISVVIHPQSIVHSLVEFVDGSLKAQLGEPDMRVPIQSAITHPGRPAAVDGPSCSLAGRSLDFEDPDPNVFPCLRLGYQAGRMGGSAPAVLNAADEIAVQAFLDRRIGFGSIAEIVEKTLASIEHRPVRSIDEVLDVDREARAVAHQHLGGSC
jgi:1-deoxy-D-xylulose-5-phosphate reductoisomerase